MLYKYINWDDIKARRFLTDNELYFSSPGNWLKDDEYLFQFSTSLDRNFHFLNSLIKDLQYSDPIQYVQWVQAHMKKYSINIGTNSLVDKDKVVETLCWKRAKELFKNQQEHKEANQNNLIDRTGIFCLSKERIVYKLWQHKRSAVSDNVVCVGIDDEQLYQHERPGNNTRIAPVEYSDDLVKYDIIFDETGQHLLSTLLDVAFHLPTKYKCEKEVRVHRTFRDNSDNSEERILKLDNSVFKELIVLLSAEEEMRADVVKLAKSKGDLLIQHAVIDETGVVTVL